MYVILVYDVNEKRVNLINNYLKRYLFWIQNSVFEGEINERIFKKMVSGIKKIINIKEDSILIYIIPSKSLIIKRHIGKKKGKISYIA